MNHRSVLLLLSAVALCSWCSTGLADQEADLLRKFGKQNQTAANKLRHEAARLLSQQTALHPAKDVEPLRKVLAQLQEDRTLPKSERTALVRQLQERMQLCKSLTDKTPPPVAAAPQPVAPGTAAGDPKLRVMPANVTLGGVTVNVPDGGTRVLGGAGFMSQGRNEAGVPLLGKLPYLGRGFRNVGYGSSVGTVQSSVSVRIIILEEEAARLLNGQK